MISHYVSLGLRAGTFSWRDFVDFLKEYEVNEALKGKISVLTQWSEKTGLFRNLLNHKGVKWFTDKK